ncbi:MAG: Cof-type HAD-IIB family hydrolase [Clostridia bacterium]|nr:Cof-type HAD-IIB family hydrolase [Clostridia bacterium]
MKKLFVTDLDGTLLTKEERVSEYSRERLNRMIERGLLFTFATARSYESAKKAVSGLDLNIPVALYNGGLIYHPKTNEVLNAVLFNDADKSYIYSVLRAHNIQPFVFGVTNDRSRERVSWIAGSETIGMQRYLLRRKGDTRVVSAQNEAELLSGAVFYFKCIGPQSTLERAWNDLKLDSRYICIYHQETYQSDFWMEISPREATKANGVKKIKSILGCDKVVCFGDTSNDSDMFDVCDEKYAVMNADEWLKRKSTGVIGYCEEDGVAKWLEKNSGFGD